MTYKPPPPDAERCEACTWGSYSHSRCDKRSKYVVLLYPKRDLYTHALQGEPCEFRLCGMHKNQAARGRHMDIYRGKGKGFEGIRIATYYGVASEQHNLKQAIQTLEWGQSSKSREFGQVRHRAAEALWAQAPEILEMLFMVAERGDDRAWGAIKIIEQGMESVGEASEAYKQITLRLNELHDRLDAIEKET